MIARFEDLIAWQKARELTRLVYAATREGAFARDFGLAGQIQRAAVSIMSNIAEGYERNRTNDYLNFLIMAKASCAEVRSQVYVVFDIGYLDQPMFDCLMERAQEVGRILGALHASVSKYRK